MSGGHGSGGVRLGPYVLRVLIWGLIVILGPGVVRATYRAWSAEYVEPDLWKITYKFVADMNYGLAPAVIPFLAVMAVVAIAFIYFNVM